MDSPDSVFAGFDEAVLERWGFKPTAKDTLTRAKERGSITPQEISEMVSTALSEDRQKMLEALQELKKVLQNLNITITFNVVHTHTHIVQSPAVAPAIPVAKPEPQPKAEEQTVPPVAVATGQQYAGQGHESPFLNAKVLQEHGLKPEALGILSVAQAKGFISPQQIGTLIPAEISQDSEKLRPTMRWITQLLGAINIKVVIGEVHYKKPESHSPVTSYSRRPEKASFRRNKVSYLFDSTGISEEPSKEVLLELEKDEEGTAEGSADGEESENADPNGEFVPKFIFDRESGVSNPYYRAVKDHKFLKHQDLLELARRWHMHGDYEARNTIVVHNLRLSMKIASHYMGRGLDYDDLVQEGNIGLMVAAERFDPEQGFYFTTYATWWVRNKITCAIRNIKDLIRSPAHVHESYNKILKITCELGMELQREPTLEEVAARAEEDIGKVKKILHQLKVPVVSLEELAYSASSKDSDVTIGDHIMDNCFPSAVTALEAKEDLEIASRNILTLLAALKALPLNDRYKTVFRMYWGLEGYSEGATFDSIKDSFGVTRGRIQQMEEKVWNELARYEFPITRDKLEQELKRVHDLENIVCAEADLSTPTEALILDEVSIVFQDEAEKNGGEMVPGVIITSRRLTANLKEVEQVENQKANLEGEPEQVSKLGIVTPNDIIRVVGNVYGKTPEMILGESKPNEVVWTRWVCAYIMREELKSSFVGIGQALHYADHTTAMHGHRSIEKAIERDSTLGEEIEKIIALCGLRQQAEQESELTTESAPKPLSPMMEQVLDLTSQAFGIEKSALFARSHTRPDEKEKYRIRAKCFAMHVLRSDFNVQCQEIATMFGFGDYSRASVLCNRMAEEVKADASLQEKLALIRGQYSLEVYGGNLEQVRQCQKTLFPKQVEEMKSIVEKVVKPFQEKVRQLHAKLEALDVPNRHKEILKFRYAGEPTKETLTYEALGQTYDITRERVRQILVTTMERLTPTLEPSDVDLMEGYAQEFEKVRLVVELQNL